MLERSKYNPSVFITARSIAKCADKLEHLREMVQLLVRYRESFHELVVDIIKESEMDCTPLMMEFLDKEDRDLVSIALVGLPSYVIPSLVPILYRLMESGNKEIRIKAGKLLYNDNCYAIDQEHEMRGDDKHLSEIDRLFLNSRQQHLSPRLSRSEHYTKAV